MKTIGITLGEPCGIGPELAIRTVQKFRQENVHFVLYGSPNLLTRTSESLGITLPTSATVKGVGPDPSNGIFDDQDLHQRADAVLATLNMATEDVQKGDTSALVTGPIDKAVVRTRLPSFMGHTEYLAQRAGVPKTLMMMDNAEIRVVVLTTHIALRDVSTALSGQMFEEAVRLAAQSFSQWCGIEKPRFAVAGINPHAGETVKNSEEKVILEPVISRLQKEGFRIDGPLPADSLFPKARTGTWDLILSPYHDQGLVAVKYGGLDKVVNITLGLPYLRVSPGHGVAYDLAGKGEANTGSFIRALTIAINGRWMDR